jgi:IS1 family transposase/transposase-like protein
MKLTTELSCPHCQSKSIKKNGKKYNGKQNYRCKGCGRQFIAEEDKSYNGCRAGIEELVKRMFVRGSGIRDISFVLLISIKKVLEVLTTSIYQITPQKRHYDRLEIDEFWTYVGKKSNKIWLIYAYHRDSGEIVSFVWGKRDLKTANKLRKRLNRLGITYDRIGTDDWQSFITAFLEDTHDVGKEFTVGIEGNNCTFRHRIRRAFRKTCCFSKKLRNHWKAFNMVFFYINYGHI